MFWLFFWPRGTWTPSSLTWDRTDTHCFRWQSLNHWPPLTLMCFFPGQWLSNELFFVFFFKFFFFFFDVEHFKVFIKFITILRLFYVSFCFGVGLWGMWDISSPTRDWSHIPCIGGWSPNHWTAREVPWAVLWVWLRGHLSRQLLGNVVYGRLDFGVAMIPSVSETYAS